MPGADPDTRCACSDLSHSVSGSIGPRYESFRMWLEAMSEDASVMAALSRHRDAVRSIWFRLFCVKATAAPLRHTGRALITNQADP
ncbi:protein of unknown function (plasmid) [Cupriavidus taiwanensis]|uniref:Uncharacterized protein n=1 Tax=Cupriavidus taiwanensis TaxID=164546 RepID=A0A9Q7UUB3_9BURK|nr:protein of unknown function [Cupriavidus taiwanensis]